MVSQAELEAAIHEKVGEISTLYVSDVSGGCGQAYDVVIVSDQFQGMPTLKRHRLVNDRLKDEIAGMHAFSQKTYTPQQFVELRSKYEQSAEAPPPGDAPPVTLDSLEVQPPANVAVPELTLTPDASGRSGSDTSAPVSPLPSSHVGTGISRLHFARIASVEFWLNLRKELEQEFLHADSVQFDSPDTPRHNPRRPAGEAEVERVFEDFFLSQKHHLSANDIARIRDATGILGMAGR